MTVNVSDFLREAAENDPDGTALVVHREVRHQLSWADLDSAADAIARSLSGRGLVAGQRVAIVMANRIDLPVAYFGVLRGGMVAVPMNPRSTTREIGRMIDDAKVKVVLCDEAGATQVREALAGGYMLMAESDVHVPVNVGNPEELTLLELAQAVIEVTESKSEVIFEALPIDDPQVRQPDIARAQQLLGWEPTIGLREGLRMTIEQAGVEQLVDARY